MICHDIQSLMMNDEQSVVDQPTDAITMFSINSPILTGIPMIFILHNGEKIPVSRIETHFHIEIHTEIGSAKLFRMSSTHTICLVQFRFHHFLRVDKKKSNCYFKKSKTMLIHFFAALGTERKKNSSSAKSVHSYFVY